MAIKLAGETYDDFYQRGGWPYDLHQELLFLHFRILQPLGLSRGRALELGCGLGVQTEALRLLLGFAHGVDTSSVAIDQARRHFPQSAFTHGDALDFLNLARQWELIFARGMSWFHDALEPNASPYPLSDLMQRATASLVSGGYFALQIRTDFTGAHDPSGIRHHTVSQLSGWAERYGRPYMLIDWMGLPLASDAEGRASGRNAIVVLQKT